MSLAKKTSILLVRGHFADAELSLREQFGPLSESQHSDKLYRGAPGGRADFLVEIHPANTQMGAQLLHREVCAPQVVADIRGGPLQKLTVGPREGGGIRAQISTSGSRRSLVLFGELPAGADLGLVG